MIYLILGTAFGWVLSRSGAADYGYIQRTFLFEHIQLYGIFAAGLAVTIPGLWLGRKLGRIVPIKPMHKGNIVGGILFGMGWSITGMCPGPIFVNIGEGKLYALAALAGAICGTYLLGLAYPHMQRILGLPSLEEGGSGQG